MDPERGNMGETQETPKLEIATGDRDFKKIRLVTKELKTITKELKKLGSVPAMGGKRKGSPATDSCNGSQCAWV